MRDEENAGQDVPPMMKDITPPPIFDHDRHATMRPKPSSPLRRVACGVVGVALVPLALEFLGMAINGHKPFLLLSAAGITAFCALVLLGSALFPSFTLAREHLDRRGNR